MSDMSDTYGSPWDFLSLSISRLVCVAPKYISYLISLSSSSSSSVPEAGKRARPFISCVRPNQRPQRGEKKISRIF